MLRLICSVLLLLPCTSASAQQSDILGVWQLVSFVNESVGTKERKPVYGERPKGYLVVTPERFTAIITAEGRKVPQSDEERIAAFRTMFSYTIRRKRTL